MVNPWLAIPEHPPYVAPVDADFLQRLLERLGDKCNLKLDLLPQPWTGNVDKAEIVLLTLNPGFSPDDYAEIRDPDYREQWRLALSFGTRVPFYFLDPAFQGTGGYRYWNKRLRELIDVAGVEAVASKVMCVEHFPYKSTSYKPLGVTLPSQMFSFELVRDAVRQGKQIVVMRSERVWLESVPELTKYSYIRLSNNQNPFLSRRQMTADQFERLTTALRRDSPNA